MHTMSNAPGDIGPDDAMDLDGGDMVPGDTRGATGLVVPLTPSQLAAVELIADERGITAIEAVQRLVEEGLETRARRSAA